MSEPLTSTGPSGSSLARPADSAGTPRPQRGPETVINPERRAAATPLPASAAPGSPANSGIVRILFPPEEDPGGGVIDTNHSVRLGHFTIVERIRSGGMGAVFRAIDEGLNRVVALKVLPPGFSRDPLIVQRFKNEAQAAAQLDHENIARVFYIGEEQGLHFIAFEYVTGTNVRELIQQQGRLNVSDAVNFALQIASALVHTSAQGVVHRDIKPSNIIITPSGRAKLVDLGLARKENRDDEAADLTMAGTTLGTFDYISPEQARDPRMADVRSDIYSLGCTLYHMLTGDPPYPEGTVLQKLLQHQGDEAPDPAQKNSAVPENLSIVVRKMMAKDPRRRYQNAEQLVRDMLLVAGAMGLRSVSPEGLVWLSANPNRPSFWERHLAWMATAAVLLVIVGYLEYGPQGRGSAHRSATPNPPERALPASPGATAALRDGESANRPPVEGDTASPRGFRAGVRQVITGLPPADLTAGAPQDAHADRSAPNADDDELPPPAEGLRPLPLVNGDRTRDGGRMTLGPETPPREPGRRGSTPDLPFGPSVADGRDAPENLRSDDRGAAPPVREKGTNGGKGATAGGATPRSVSGERGSSADSAPGRNDDEGFYLLGRDGAPDRLFPTLEAACSEIRRDGAVVELRFDGRRTESSVKISRRVEIRAARGRHPVLEFRPRPFVTDSGQVRAISIPSGALYLVGIELALVVDDTGSADQWALFSIEHPDSLRLEDVIATVVNPRMTTAAIVELRPAAGAMMPDMPAIGGQSRPPLEIELANCLLRGQCDLFSVRHAEPARLAVRQSVVGVQGALLSARGSTEATQENAQLELKLEHVTAGLGNGLIRLDSGFLPRKLLPVQLLAFDCIFSNAGGGALVTMTGKSPAQDFRGLLIWNGTNNVYDRYHTYWSIESMEEMGRTESWDFAAWCEKWTDAKEANAHEVGTALSIWNARRPWFTKPMTDLTTADFALDRRAGSSNPAVSRGTNSTDAGADLERIPRPAAGLDAEASLERRRE